MRTLVFLSLFAASLCGNVYAACEFDIDVADSLEFSQTELTVDSSCTTVTINLSHTGQLPAAAMGHNWVLAETSNVNTVANNGLASGLDNNWVKPDDELVLASTKLIGGGEKDSITFSIENLKAGGDYTYICSAPGHWQLMQGKLIIQ